MKIDMYTNELGSFVNPFFAVVNPSVDLLFFLEPEVDFSLG